MSHRYQEHSGEVTSSDWFFATLSMLSLRRPIHIQLIYKLIETPVLRFRFTISCNKIKKLILSFFQRTYFNFKVSSIQEESGEVTSSDTFFATQSMLSLRRPINVVRKLVTTQRRSSLQRLSSSITNLAEVCGKAARGVHSQKPLNDDDDNEMLRHLCSLYARSTCLLLYILPSIT